MPTPAPATLLPVIERLVALLDADDRPDRVIAERAGLAPQQISHLRRGVRRKPSIETVARILDVLGQPWGALDGVAKTQRAPKKKSSERY